MWVLDPLVAVFIGVSILLSQNVIDEKWMLVVAGLVAWVAANALDEFGLPIASLAVILGYAYTLWHSLGLSITPT